jgi:hypothetical protein
MCALHVLIVRWKKPIQHNFAAESESATARDSLGAVMGSWGLFASGFFAGLCVGQLVLAFFLGLWRKDIPDNFPLLERES